MFLLQAKDTCYAMQVSESGYLCHVYWGKKVRRLHPEEIVRKISRSMSPSTDGRNLAFSLDNIPLEYPSYGNSDFRNPAFQVQFYDGSTVAVPKYKSHRIYPGKPALSGLPATYVENSEEADSLEIELSDDTAGLRIILLYTAFRDRNVITRSARFQNNGSRKIKILRALSMSVDLPHDRYDMLQLSGAWARERHIYKRALVPGMQSVESRRGASSHQQNPFLALMSKDAGEKSGEIYAVNLVYSGNFFAGAEVDQFATTRFFMGINPFDFSWILGSGEAFQAPEAVLVYSFEGLGGMSRTFHSLYRERLCRGKFRDRARPVLINNWEATYFDFNSEKIMRLVQTASEQGIELFVLDDGWFGNRNDDTTSLGDWTVNLRKIPEGLSGLAKKVIRSGLRFGIWMEPEMVSRDSELYRAHPDWCLHVEGRERTESRNQLVLDLSRQDVCNYLENMITGLLTGAPVSYVKWDMNRNLTEVGSSLLPHERQRETAHRYLLGLYGLLEKIINKFPNLLFEGCAGGGGRFDPGMLYYMPQIWTSDDTDAVERLKIQYGTSLVYPASAMGAHVSAVPNHQVGRMTPLATRCRASLSGDFGFELDLNRLSKSELREIKNEIDFYKKIRELVQFGILYRLRSPFQGDMAAWMYVSDDQKLAYVSCFSVLSVPNAPIDFLRLDGLNPDREYTVTSTGKIYGGDELMNVGFPLPVAEGDFQSWDWLLTAFSN
ncbi:Alpha-galactosidase AgaA [Caprobacter fermentans]|uniref:Alpha-galactosidase n=2 Tax=Caproicibacter fermentans TaxID=2576756 RepID=A0A6N8HYL6_9FIRM|nr:alpha-galactosidase [Caproicibacter fermentans]MVB10852.1 Alpha-galactosidase AgaA [Caproicibacter fermentans]